MFLKLLLIATIPFVLCSFSPSWKSCSAWNEAWQPNSVSLSAKPAQAQSDSINACGMAQDALFIGSYTMTVYTTGSVPVYSTRVYLQPDQVFKGGQYCFSHTEYIPNFADDDYHTTFTLLDTNNKKLGCFNMEVDLGNTANFSCVPKMLQGMLILLFCAIISWV